MKYSFRAALVACFLALVTSTAAYSQDHERNWENGYVVQVTEVHTKDGMFNAYINDLNAGWRRVMEAQKEAGDVISYGMYSVANPREGEADLILTVTYKNWATFDRGIEYFEELGSEVFGSLDDMRTESVDRGELRTIGSSYTLQQVTFKE